MFLKCVLTHSPDSAQLFILYPSSLIARVGCLTWFLSYLFTHSHYILHNNRLIKDMGVFISNKAVKVKHEPATESSSMNTMGGSVAPQYKTCWNREAVKSLESIHRLTNAGLSRCSHGNMRLGRALSTFSEVLPASSVTQILLLRMPLVYDWL